jgi:hypothetical protein
MLCGVRDVHACEVLLFGGDGRVMPQDSTINLSSVSHSPLARISTQLFKSIASHVTCLSREL